MDCTPIFKKVIKASRTLNVPDTNTINKVLLMVADTAVANAEYIVTENKKDLALIDESDPGYEIGRAHV